MKKAIRLSGVTVLSLLVIWAMVPMVAATAAEGLRYSCSAQVYEAFENKRLDVFTKATGIPIELSVASSQYCVYRAMRDLTDIASSTRALYQRYKDYGLVEIPFCKDPLAVITHKSATVDSLTSEQLQQIFSGDIANWKEVGGPDLSITLVVPGEETGANKNFRRLIMKDKEIKYDYSTYLATRVLEAIESLPVGAVSFISRGAQISHPNIKVVAIDGKKPGEENYPYYQTFYMISKGQPTGAIKTFVDFIKSDSGRAIILERGMLPVN